MITDAQVEEWTQQARRDDWHRTFVGSDIRQMLAEIVRLRAALATAHHIDGRPSDKTPPLSASAPAGALSENWPPDDDCEPD